MATLETGVAGGVSFALTGEQREYLQKRLADRGPAPGLVDRSAALARELARRGRAQVVNVEGSLFEWANRGWPVHRGNAVVTLVHPFDADWGQLLDRRLWSTQRP